MAGSAQHVEEAASASAGMDGVCRGGVTGGGAGLSGDQPPYHRSLHGDAMYTSAE